MRITIATIEAAIATIACGSAAITMRNGNGFGGPPRLSPLEFEICVLGTQWDVEDREEKKRIEKKMLGYKMLE